MQDACNEDSVLTESGLWACMVALASFTIG